MKIDNTSQCETCKFCICDDSNSAKILMTCERDGKTRYYGQYIDCDRKEVVACSEEE
jgi:hypothetical protein